MSTRALKGCCINHRIQIIIELVFNLIRVGHYGCIDTYNCCMPFTSSGGHYVFRKSLGLVSSIKLYGASNYNIFSNHLRIRLSPIKSPILLKYKNPYKRNNMYPNISKCNAKSCTCCNHLICRSTIISSVNHRQFSVVNNSDLD